MNENEWPDHVVNDPKVKRILALGRSHGFKMLGLGLFMGGWLGQTVPWIIFVGIGVVVLGVFLEPR